MRICSMIQIGIKGTSKNLEQLLFPLEIQFFLDSLVV